MHLEVLIESEKPIIYILNKPEIYIGSANTNDIVIHCFNISRKHIKIVLVGESYHVTDIGSTNGSFMNEEQLIPGRRYEFKMSESIRLGDRVFLTLLDKKQNKNSSKIAESVGLNNPAAPTENVKHSTTRVVSLKELNAAKNKKVQKQRNELFKKKQKESQRLKAEKESFRRVSKIMAAWIILGVVAHFGWQSLSNRIAYSFKPMKKEGIDRVAQSHIERSIITEAELLPRENVIKHAAEVKCLTEEENQYCNSLSFLSQDNNGLRIVDGSYLFMIEQSLFIYEAGEFLKLASSKTQSLEEISWETITQVAFLNVLKDHLSPVIQEGHNNLGMYVVFYSKDGEASIVNSIFAFKGGDAKLIARQYYQQLKSSQKKNILFKVPTSKLYITY